MDSFRSMIRDQRDSRRSRSHVASSAGQGHLFCEIHRHRFPTGFGGTTFCPLCMPGQIPKRRVRR